MTDMPPPTKPRVPFFGKKLTARHILTPRLALFFVLGAAGLAALGWSGQRTHEAAAEDPAYERAPLAVAVTAARRVESYPRLRTFTGVLRGARRSQLSFQRAGEVVAIAVDEGGRVASGQELARLDQRHIFAQQAQLEAQLREARAVFDELSAGPRQESIAAKRAEVRALEAQSAILEKKLARRAELVRQKSISKEEYETFYYELNTAVARADAARRELDELVAGTRGEQIAAQEARVAQLEARLADVDHDLEDAVLTAPFAGRVAKRLIDEGAVVAAGTGVLEIIDDTHLEAWFGLPVGSTQGIDAGDSYQLQIGDRSVEAVAYALSPDIDPATRTRNVILTVAGDEANLYPGQVVRLPLRERIEEAGFWLPTTSLIRANRGLWGVLVVEQREGEQVVARRDVEVLDTVGDQSFVRGALVEGDQVIASGVHRVVVGQRVSPSMLPEEGQ